MLPLNAPARLPAARRDRAAERAAQTRMLLGHERALEARVGQLVAQLGRQAAQAHRHGESTDVALAAYRNGLQQAIRASLTAAALDYAHRLMTSPKAAHAWEAKAFEDLDAAIARHMTQHAAEAVVGISESTRAVIARVIAEGIAENLGQEEIAARIVEATSGEIALQRARRIARTEVHFAAMYGQQAAAEASPLAFVKEWLATEDARTRQHHAEAHGQRVPLTGVFRVGDVTLRYPGDTAGPPGEIINCFPAGTRVSGNVIAATRHWYEGELVQILTSEWQHLSGTPNHPVLTAGGWVALGELHEGDDLVCSPRTRGNDASAGRAADVEDRETLIEQVFDALARSGERVRLPSLAVNFHGDRPAQEVDVVRSDRVLQLGGDAALLEHAGEFPLADADLAERAGLPERFAGQLGGRCGGGAASSVRRARECLALLGRRLRHTLAHRLAAVARLAASGAQCVRNHAALTAESGRDRLHRLAGVEEAHSIGGIGRAQRSDVGRLGIGSGSHDAGAFEPALHRGHAAADRLGGSAEAQTGAVKLDRVVSIWRVPFSGHVYNLETVEGAYAANGVIAHNCRCACLYEPQPYPKGQEPQPASVEPVSPADVAQPEPEVVDEVPTPEPEAVEEPAPELVTERDLEQRPYEREAVTLYAAGALLSLDDDSTPRVGEVRHLIGPADLFFTPDAPEVDRQIASNPGGLFTRRPVLWQITIPGGPWLPEKLVEMAAGGWVINSGVGRFGLVPLTVRKVRKVRWSEVAAKPLIDPTRFAPAMRDFIEMALARVDDPDWKPADVANTIGLQLMGWRDLEDDSGVPESVLRTLRDTPWSRRSLRTYLERLLAGEIQDMPGPDEPDTEARVIVVEAEADVLAAVPEGYQDEMNA